MLLKHSTGNVGLTRPVSFSTLYRVDAIEAAL